MKVKNFYREKTRDCISDFWFNYKYISSYIKDCHQNEKDCLFAVRAYGWALSYVKNQTPKICLAAVLQNNFALKYVINTDLKLKIGKELNL